MTEYIFKISADLSLTNPTFGLHLLRAIENGY
nr:MAG TPA: hypothetical protein [Caudoviricetes sp.]